MNNMQTNLVDPYIVQHHNLDAYEYILKAEEELYYKDLLEQQEEYER